MQNITPKTLFTGQQVIYLPQCGSTNSYAHELLIKNSATDGCVVVTDCQTNGRGQRGNTWEAEPGKNLTLSYILKPHFLAAQHQFYLNICVSLAVVELVKVYLGSNYPKITLKWPNDVYYGNYKIGGILIENSLTGQFIQHSVIGIGLNINQLSFLVAGALSFSQITGKQYHLATIIERLSEQIEARYLQLQQGKFTKLKTDYLQCLYRYQEEHLYVIAGKQVPGTIMGIDDIGRLGLKTGHELQYFNFKEIAFVI